MNALLQVKRSISNASHWATKLNAYTGYVVRIATYASETWLPSRTEMGEIERVQQDATKWILSTSMSYKERLRLLNFLPLSLCSEMQDLTYLLSIHNGDYDFSVTSNGARTTKTAVIRQANTGEFQLDSCKPPTTSLDELSHS